MQYKKDVFILPLRNEILFSLEVELLLAQGSVKHHSTYRDCILR